MKRVLEILYQDGFVFLFKKVLIRIRKVIIQKINSIKLFIFKKKISRINYCFVNKIGLEVGGPSEIFRYECLLPIYSLVEQLDGCNFSNNTIWEGNIDFLKKYNYYENKKGVQYISDATNLNIFTDSRYDFIISSNCLEHIANPLKALKEWIRVLKKGGVLLLVIPNKKYCFDHNRSITEFSHLLLDFQNNIEEDDLTHLDEILKLHDLTLDEAAGNYMQFKERSYNNFQNRALHQHIFDLDILKVIFRYLKLKVLITFEDKEFIIIGKKIMS